jgi:hypothetical protein
MAKSARTTWEDTDTQSDAYELTIKWDGALADTGEIPAAELGAALQGWDRFLQLAFYSYQSSDLQIPKPGTTMRVDFRVRRVRKGSFVVDASITLGGIIATGVIGNAAYDAIKKVWGWSVVLVKTHIKAKRERKTLDGVVEELEAVAKQNEIRVSVDREDTEDFAAALNAALDNATAPLDSSAAKEVLSLKGQTVEIVVDEAGRQAIKLPFEPPKLDPDADDVIEAPVKFIRINKKTGYGLMSFVRPADASQLSQQRFHCEDKSIRRRANQYTGSFHEDVPLVVKMQRKNYATERRGHYWLILGTANPSDEDLGLFAKAERKRKRKKGRTKKGDE